MSTQQKLRGGSSVQHEAFTGAEREVTFDTTRKGLVAHDALRAGGWPIPNFSEIQRRSFTAGNAVGVDTGAITITLPVPPPGGEGGIVPFLSVTFKADANSTGACTVNLNETLDIPLKKMSGGALEDIEADDIVTGGIYTISFNGTSWILEGGPGGGGSIIKTRVVYSPGGSTWVKPEGLLFIDVMAQGGGGGGASATSSYPGGAGGTSSFGTHCSATGGAGGPTGPVVTASGGSGSGGDYNLRGRSPGVLTKGGDSFLGNGAVPNSMTASNGGGGCWNSTFSPGAGGGFTQKIIQEPDLAATVAVTVGGGGYCTNGGYGTGGAGIVIVDQYIQG